MCGESLSDEDHTELNIKYITLSIYHPSCQVWSAGAVKKQTKKNAHTENRFSPSRLYVEDVQELMNLGHVTMH